jgi:hypothetical protein
MAIEAEADRSVSNVWMTLRPHEVVVGRAAPRELVKRGARQGWIDDGADGPPITGCLAIAAATPALMARRGRATATIKRAIGILIQRDERS